MSLLLLQLGFSAVGLPPAPGGGSFRNRSRLGSEASPGGMRSPGFILSSNGSTPAQTPNLSPRALRSPDALNVSSSMGGVSGPFSNDEDAFSTTLAQKAALNLQCEVLKQNVVDLKKEKDTMGVRMNALETRVQQLQQEIVRLTQTGVTDQAALLQKEAALKVAQDALADAQRRTNDAQQTVETYKRQVTTLSAKTGVSEKLMADLEAARANGESQAAQWQSSLQEKIAELQANAQTIAQLRAELDKIAKTAGVSETVLSELNSLRTKNEEQERILASFREQIELMQKGIAEKTETLRKAETELGNARAAQKRLETSLDAAQAQCAQQEHVLEEYETQLATMRQNIAELEGRLALAGTNELELKQTLAAQIKAVQALVEGLTEIFEKQSKLPPVPPIRMSTGSSSESAFDKKLREISEQQEHIRQLLNACLTSFKESSPETARSSRSTQLMARPLQADQNSQEHQERRDLEKQNGELLSGVTKHRNENERLMNEHKQLHDNNQQLRNDNQQLHNTIVALQNKPQQPKEKAKKGCC